MNDKHEPVSAPLIFDSHAHYESGEFDQDREALLSKTLPEAGVCGVINMGSDLDTCYKTLALTEVYDYFYGAVGIHPESAKELPEDYLERLRSLLRHPKIVAVGEIGLDYHWLDACPKPRQQEVFRRQLALANETGKPVVIHDREAHLDVMTLLREYRPRGVMHCFSGSVELSREVVQLGLYIGLGGVVTFKNAKHAVAVAADLPLDRLLLETDAPYMAPEPRRGRRNDSSLIRYIAQRIADIRHIPVDTVYNAAAANTRLLFGIS